MNIPLIVELMSAIVTLDLFNFKILYIPLSVGAYCVLRGGGNTLRGRAKKISRVFCANIFYIFSIFIKLGL